jgi:peptide deformylase
MDQNGSARPPFCLAAATPGSGKRAAVNSRLANAAFPAIFTGDKRFPESQSMILPIVHYPAPVLRQSGAPVVKIDDEIRRLADDMVETMYDAHGVGLAAQQVGVAIQLAVVDVSHDEECVSYLRVNGEERRLADICPLVFVNPSLKLRGPKEGETEGCLSFPDLRGEIIRPSEVVATVGTLSGETLVIETDGLFSRAIQHETDHLFGRLFIDRMSSARKLAIRPLLREMQEQFR